MNQKTFMYAAYTFVILALVSKGTNSLRTAAAKKAPAMAQQAQPKKKKSNFFSKALGFGRKLIGFDEAGQPIYALADESVI